MKIESATFLTSAKDLSSCPRSSLPEVAFIGRSNVGKSSLVNMLTKQKGLARVSKKPGATKLINFYTMDGWWNLVDLPGYGYAKVSKGQQSGFNLAVSEYLAGRKQLKLVCALIDSRYEPMELDLAFFQWMQDCSAPLVIVMTKTDQVSTERWKRNVAIYEETLQAMELPVPDIIACSSVERAGRGELLGYLQRSLPRRQRRGEGTGVQLNWLKRK